MSESFTPMGDIILAKYTFLSHLRRGVATQINDNPSGNDSERATFNVVLQVKGRLLDLPGIEEAALETLIVYPEVTRKIPLYGPGDVIGIHPQAIIKTAPAKDAKNFESNYLPFIEFYDEDFPWRYTPEAPVSGQLAPWITLAVLKAGNDDEDDEFTENGIQSGAPLQSITIHNPADVLPPPDELWAWAHVQVNDGLLEDVVAAGVVVVPGQDDNDKIKKKLQALLDNNPDLAYARLICPRKLEEDTEYHAFLIPTYESGRLAGLGQDNSSAGIDKAWSADTVDKDFPYYFRWRFKTSPSGDFEKLVKDLNAQPVPPEVGTRLMDVSQPHEFLPGITENNGILQLGGALRVPFTNLDADARAAFVKNDNWAPAFPGEPHDFQQRLKEFINLSETYKEEETVQAAHDNTDIEYLTEFGDDPLITPPLYGRWHAGVSKLLDSDEYEGNGCQTLAGYEATVTAVAISPDARFVLTGDENGSLLKWQIGENGVPKTLDDNTGAEITALAINADGSGFLAGLADGRVKIKKSNGAADSRDFIGQAVTAVAFFPDGSGYLAGSSDGNIKIFIPDLPQQTLNSGIEAAIQTLDVSKDGKYGLAGFENGLLQLFTMPEDGVGQPGIEYTLDTGDTLKSAAFAFQTPNIPEDADTPDFAYIILACHTGSGHELRILKWILGEPESSDSFVVQQHPGAGEPLAMAFSEKGDFLAVAAGAGEVTLWDNKGNWIHELNLDPRHRATAGFGTGVIQTNQEKYMAAAWEQVGDILEANRRIRRSRMQAETAGSWHRRYFEQMPGNPVLADLAFWVTAPLHSRILTTENKTLAHHIRQSAIPPVMLSATVRRTLRPRARVARHLAGAGARYKGITGLLAGLNEGALNAAPPRTVPAGLLTIRHFAETIKPVGAPSWILQALSRYPWFKYAPLAMGAVVALVLLVLVSALPLLVASVALAGGLGWAGHRKLVRWERQKRAFQFLAEANLRPGAVDELPKSPNFRISEPGSGFRPRQGNTDSEEAKRFKQALRGALETIEKVTAAPPEKVPVQLPFQSVVSQVVGTVKPAVTIPKRLYNQLMIPVHVQKFIGEDQAESLEEIMAYPEFDLPMYKPLAAISHDLFLPRMHHIPKSSITLLETNQKFIEAYLVGLNHEFGRELLWREYPTDQRGSYFRQFWGVTDALKPFSTIEKDIRDEYKTEINSLPGDEAKRRFVREKVISRRREEVEKARDIPPIHEWDAASKLGSHDYRETSGDQEEELVLVIRGELLERYPNAVIFAQKAKKDGEAFVLADSTEKNIKIPIYEARVENVLPPPETESRNGATEESPQKNIYLFGFDLTAEEAKGSDADPGWFFVIQERPGEPRFGLDMPENNGNDLFVWNDLDWGDVSSTGSGHIEVGNPSLNLPADFSSDNAEKQNQYDEDINVQWNGGNSAHFAYILYQAPVMVAYHASEMLKPKEENES